jgi:hypothetical protein
MQCPMCLYIYIYIYIYIYGLKGWQVSGSDGSVHWVRCICTAMEDFDTGDQSGVKVKLPAGYQVMSR